MAMRDLVTGAPSCGEPSSSSNPLGALANALIGSSSKTQVYRNSLFLRETAAYEYSIWTEMDVCYCD